MARCRCLEGQCGCHLRAGTGIGVTGDGSSAKPWVIHSVGNATGAVKVGDTTTVDMMVNGGGTPNDPYVLTAHAMIGPLLDAGNTPEVEMTATGAGTELDPMVLTATLPLITFTGGNPGDVLTMDAAGVFYPGPPTQAPAGSVSTGFGISGDGSGANPFRVDLCSYDDLKAACA